MCLSTSTCIRHFYRAVIVLLSLILAACTSTSQAPSSTTPPQTLSCTVVSPTSAPTITVAGLQQMIALPGHPYASAATRDGRWLFVSLDASDSHDSNGVAVLQRVGREVQLVHIIPLPGFDAGTVLTQDDKLLLVAVSTGVAFLDTVKAESGQQAAVLGTIVDADNAGTTQVTLSRDEHYAFATNENVQSMSVINLQQVRTNGVTASALVGQVPLDLAPVGMAISPNDRSMYVTSEVSTEAASKLGRDPAHHPTGTLTVVDVAHGEHDPSHAVIARMSAGCSPVRVILSPAGDIAWVTARESNALLAFSTSKLLTDPKHALLSATPVGPAPVGMVLINNGTTLVVANSNRFAADQSSPQTLMLLDVKDTHAAHPVLRGSILVGSFPREMVVEGQSLFLTNYNSKTLSVIDTTKLPKGS